MGGIRESNGRRCDTPARRTRDWTNQCANALRAHRPTDLFSGRRRTLAILTWREGFVVGERIENERRHGDNRDNHKGDMVLALKHLSPL